MISAVPQPSAVNNTIWARQTCFCGLFRVRHDRIQLDTIRRTHVDFDTGAHPADSHVSTIAGIRIRTQMSDFIH
jgi:hypothetical protein